LSGEEFLEGLGGDTLGIFRVVDQEDIPLWKRFVQSEFENIAAAQILRCKFRRDKADSQIMTDCREDHIGGGQLDVRAEGQTVLAEIMVQEIPGDGAGGQADPGKAF